MFTTSYARTALRTVSALPSCSRASSSVVTSKTSVRATKGAPLSMLSKHKNPSRNGMSALQTSSRIPVATSRIQGPRGAAKGLLSAFKKVAKSGASAIPSVAPPSASEPFVVEEEENGAENVGHVLPCPNKKAATSFGILESREKAMLQGKSAKPCASPRPLGDMRVLGEMSLNRALPSSSRTSRSPPPPPQKKKPASTPFKASPDDSNKENIAPVASEIPVVVLDEAIVPPPSPPPQPRRSSRLARKARVDYQLY
jgi:hypothetical protein